MKRLLGRSAFVASVAALIVITAGCATTRPEAAVPLGIETKESDSRAGAQPRDRLVVHAGYIAIEVSTLSDIEPKIAAIVKESKGYVAQSRMNANEYNTRLKVPAQELEAVMNKLAKLGNPVRRSVQTEDVTDQHIDYEAKLKNLIALRDQLRDLLAKAKSVKETLEVEQELSRVQSQIDSLQGQLDALNNRIAYSTLDVQVAETRIYGPIGYLFKGISWVAEKLFVIR